MTRDMTPWVFGHAVDHAVEVLLPKGSCSKDRWLTFDLEAVGDDDQTFRYLLQYRATSNYIDWRVVVPDEVHFRRGDGHDFGHEDDGWVNISKMSGPALRTLAKLLGLEASWIGTTFNREKVLEQIRNAKGNGVLAPGYVINSGSHDSGWRDHAMTLEGCPRMLPEGAKFRERTVWMSSHRVKEVIVHSMKVEGKTGGMWNPNDPRWEKFTDGEWVNPHPEFLTGAWAVITGLAILYKTTGILSPLHIELDTRLQYYRQAKEGDKADKDGRVTTSAKRVSVAYKIDDEGRVLQVALDKSKSGLPQWVWTDPPFEGLISRGRHLKGCGVPDNKVVGGLVEIESMWAR